MGEGLGARQFNRKLHHDYEQAQDSDYHRPIAHALACLRRPS